MSREEPNYSGLPRSVDPNKPSGASEEAKTSQYPTLKAEQNIVMDEYARPSRAERRELSWSAAQTAAWAARTGGEVLMNKQHLWRIPVGLPEV